LVSSINFHTKEISVKIVYYGPGLCGKTTSLQTIYNTLPEGDRPKIVSLATDVDRTIFFDFLPLTAYRIRDFKVRLQLYTVPGQVFYNATRKLVLNGVDGIVFVADSQRAMQDSNLESLQNLDENLVELGLELEHLPLVMQFNKRDLTDIHTVQEMDAIYNGRKAPVFASVALTGEGLFDALKTVSQMVVNDLIRKGLGRQLRDHERTAAAAAAPSDAPLDGFNNVAEAVTQAARSSSLWPASSGGLGDAVTRALEEGRWSAAILATERLLDDQLQKWSAGEGSRAGDGLAPFLYLRGVAPDRYRVFLRSLVAARAERSVSHADAMNAIIVALETMW
jgi:signal recognition particle receptor subunit beta